MRAALLLVSTALLLGLGSGAAHADPDARPVAVIHDARIPESSALAASTRQPGLLYTVNDSGNAPVVYAVAEASGRVVGTATLAGVDLVDPEALAIGRDDRLYVADIGDNDSVRDSIALYAIEQPLRGDVTVTPQTYAVRYADGPHNAEALVVDPASGRLVILTKELLGGAVYQLPEELVSGPVTTARLVAGAQLPGLVTDAAALPDASAVVIRTYTHVMVYGVPGWRQEASAPLPPQPQGESLAVASDGTRLLVGTEGLPSPLLAVPIPATPQPQAAEPSPQTAPPVADAEEATGSSWPAWAVGTGSVILGGAWLAVRRTQRRRSMT